MKNGLRLSKEAMSTLKHDTAELIRDSRLPEKRADDPYNDFLDLPVIPYLEIINSNPDLVSTGSCSGHDGYPFLSVIFKDARTRDRYLEAIRAKNLCSQKSDDCRMGFFENNYSALNIQAEWAFGHERKVSAKAAKEFCKTMIDVFA